MNLEPTIAQDSPCALSLACNGREPKSHYITTVSLNRPMLTRMKPPGPASKAGTRYR